MPPLDLPTAPRGKRRRRAWREGGSSTRRWDLEILGWSICAVGAGALAARAAPALFPVETAAGGARAVVWLALAVPILLALARSRPRGLLRFRPIDLVYGVVFGVLLRLAQGVFADLWEGGAVWPSTFSTDGGLPADFVSQTVAGALITPVLEEFFFRGVVLIAVYTALRRVGGVVAAGMASVAASTALFVVAHMLTASRSDSDLVALALLGLVTGAFTVGTGRIWPAVVVHAIFNATGLGLIAVGTLLA